MNSSTLPETVLQFGAGNFLRAFVDLFIHEANQEGQKVGRVVIVQSTDSNRAAALNDAGASYHVLVRGEWQGEIVDRAVKVESVSRALNARNQWDGVLSVAESPALKLIVSNTTEAGMSLSEADQQPPSGAPVSFPAKLLRVLQRRHERGLPGLTIMPCELVEENGTKLRSLCVDQGRAWGLPAAFLEYLQNQNRWVNSLVDRIVSGKPATAPELPAAAADPLLTAAEPYALWAVESNDPAIVPFQHPAIQVVPDVRPFSLRKIRILNGAHTALVCKALPMGIQTVREAVEHPEVGPWLRDVLFEEIVPVLEGRVEGPRRFAEQTLERFANPFLQHKLADIALNHEAKLKTRIVPTIEDYRAKFGKPPARLSAVVGGF